MSNRFVLGLDFGGTKLAAGVVDLDSMQVIDSAFRSTQPERGGTGAVNDMIALARDLKGVEHIRAIGVSFGGYTLNNRILKSLHVTGWNDFPLHEHLRPHFGDLPVYVANDANAVALSEYRFGAGRGSRALLFVTVSTGVGGGVVLDGQLVEGINGLAGEIGHFNAIPDNGPACPCGRSGCVEAIAAGPGMVKYARRLLDVPDNHSALRQLSDFNARDINDYAHQGDEVAIQVLQTGARYLGIALGNAINLLDLDCIVIGGGVSRAGNIWWDALRAAINATVLPWRPEVAVRPTQPGAHEGIWGGVALIPDL